MENTRKINRMLLRSESVEYDSVSRVLSNIINANVYITNAKGKIYGYAFRDDFECSIMVDKVISKGQFPAGYVKWMMHLDETLANRRSQTGMCAYEDNAKCLFNGKNTTLVPIFGMGKRVGTLIVAKYNEEFTDDDLLLCEYGATVVGMEMLKEHTQKIELEAQKKARIQIALATLSYSEAKAAKRLVSALKGEETILIASHLADQPPKITRSLIINALRKIESAGVIETQSMGAKGTRIKILNEYLAEGIDKIL